MVLVVLTEDSTAEVPLKEPWAVSAPLIVVKLLALPKLRASPRARFPEDVALARAERVRDSAVLEVTTISRPALIVTLEPSRTEAWASFTPMAMANA